MNHLILRLGIEQKELSSKIENHERLGSLIRDWAHLAFHPWREISTTLQESVEMHVNDIERDSLWPFMHRALILPLWWVRCHHPPWSIHEWKLEIRVWEKFPTNWDGSSLANHDHEMRMSWAWWDDDLGLHAFTPSSTFISNLHFLSLVLPCSCSFREREEGEKWENGLGWKLLQLMIPFSISCIWHVGPRVEWRTAHSPLSACSFGTSRWSCIMSDCLVFSIGWRMNPSTWNLALRSITFIPKVNNMTSNSLSQSGASFEDYVWLLRMPHSSGLQVALLGRKLMYSRFLLYPKGLQGSSRIFIGD